MRLMQPSTFMVIGVLGACAGCIAPKPYRPVGQLTPAVVAATPDATHPQSLAKDGQTALPVGRLCTAAGTSGYQRLTPAGGYDGQPESGPCMAFVEYNKGGRRRTDVGDQIGTALALIKTAIAEDPQHQPIVVAFVHGWKHSDDPGNAAPGSISRRPPEDENVQGFEHVLNFLYRCYYADPAKNACVATTRTMMQKSMPTEGHVVVGIYLSWYAADISPAFPVAQQISVYTRGNEADTVARRGDFRNDLEALSEAAHPRPISGHEPLLILVGHSFGGRLLEQAVTEPMEKRVAEQIAPGGEMVPTFADLVLLVNAAGSAGNGMGLLNFLARNRVQYRTTAGQGQGPAPLMATITTPADAATGVAFSIAMYPGSLAQRGSESLKGFDAGVSEDEQIFDISEPKDKLYRNTLAHLTEFQSHILKEVKMNPCTGGDASDFYFSVPEHCYHVEPAPVQPTVKPRQLHRWNGTPYWVISTDQNVIPDHGTIFTNRFMRFVGHLLPDESNKPMVTGVPES